jgi:hypothetical protein
MKQIDWHDIIAPLAIALTGAVLVAFACAGVISLDRISNLWPASLILIGLAELGQSSRRTN